MLIKDVLEQKMNNQVVMVEVSQKLVMAAQQMCEQKVSALLVYHSASCIPLGILTVHDILRYYAYHQEKLETVNVEEVMSKNPVVITPEDTVDHAKAIMVDGPFHHLPVIERNKVIGMVSLSDLVKAKLEETTIEVKYLRDYIAASFDMPIL